MLPSAQAQSCGNGPRHLVYALVYSREYKKDLILMCIMSLLRTVFFFAFALFESLTLSVRIQWAIGTRQYYASDMGASTGGPRSHGPPLWLCNKVLKPNFQTGNGCSLLSLIFAKLLLLDINSENVFALSIATVSGVATRGKGVGGNNPSPH